jgi:hypothetical protein
LQGLLVVRVSTQSTPAPTTTSQKLEKEIPPLYYAIPIAVVALLVIICVVYYCCCRSTYGAALDKENRRTAKSRVKREERQANRWAALRQCVCSAAM